MSPIKFIALQENHRDGRKKTPDTESAEVSPDSKCPICLDKFNNMSCLDICQHKFCFRCIHEWSKNKAECPLCKQPFNSIYHSIKSDENYKKYDLKLLDNGSFPTFGGGRYSSFGTYGGVRFRYRTTLTGSHRQIQGRTTPPPNSGVMFDSSQNPSQQQRDRYMRHRMMRLAAARRAVSEDEPVLSLREQEMINFRRELYRQGVRVRTVRGGGRFRDTSAEFYRRNPACLHRLIPWLKRELMVLYGADGSLVNIVRRVIMAHITRYGMEDTPIQEELRPFLQGRTDHFLHEFVSFAKSPFNMEAYDHHATYDLPAPSSNEGSGSNSSVIAISEDELTPMALDPPTESMSALSHSLWDDETPGPSYCTAAEQNRTERLSVPDSDSDTSMENEMQETGVDPHTVLSDPTQTESIQDNNDDDDDGDSDDCLIVGFVRPTSERTPELVQLSSDSEESTTETSCLPQDINLKSLIPQISQQLSPRGDPERHGQSKKHRGKSNSKERCSSLSSNRSKASNKSDRSTRDHHGSRHHRHRSRSRYSSRSRSRYSSRSRSRSRRRHRSKNREHRHRRSRGGDRHRSSRSPVASHRNKKHLYSSSRRWDSDFSYSTHSRSSQTHHYSHYSHRKGDRGTCAEKRSYYHSRYSHSERYSNSHSRSRSRESGQRDRAHRHSPTRTYSSSCSPLTRRPLHDKPGGKRKCKTRHLEDSPKHSEGHSPAKTKHKKSSKDKHSDKHKQSKNLSLEFVNNDDVASERSRHRHKKKKKHKKKSKRHRSKDHATKPSPTIITIDSDSDANGGTAQVEHTNMDNLNNCTTDDPEDAKFLPCTP